MAYVVKQDNGCWIWTGANVRGYAYFTNENGKTVRAGRWVLEQKLGRKLHPRMHACHTCDTPECVRPKHLYEGTAKQNVQDCIQRGRRGTPAGRGENNGKVKQYGITRELVSQAEEFLKTHSRSEAVSRFGMDKSTIRKIDLGIHWTQR